MPLDRIEREFALKERQKSIKPLVDEYFAWIKEQNSTTLPKSKTAQSIAYSINQEKYLREFLSMAMSRLITRLRNEH